VGSPSSRSHHTLVSNIKWAFKGTKSRSQKDTKGELVVGRGSTAHSFQDGGFLLVVREGCVLLATVTRLLDISTNGIDRDHDSS
jgi:hypothetical protein